MDVTTVLAAVTSGIVFLAWFVLPGSAKTAIQAAPSTELTGAHATERATAAA